MISVRFPANGSIPSTINSENRLSQIVQIFQLSFCTYDKLKSLLRQATPVQEDQSHGAEVYRKLTNGLP